MSDRAAAVRGLLGDIERAESTLERVRGRIAEATHARVQEVERERDALREAEARASARAERAEQRVAILREEREVIRKALRAVTGSGGSAAESAEGGRQ
ncbi:MAG: hypothetical protein OXI45_01660 [Acidobacteriota bacterium]|nr:hypothetical protein [Acidobacteriota bacterium]MDE2711370.1 hypothetical protein [Acidobacteriota bacterium]MXW71299.1 hypothetical protein [Acidobacteriota bacterium]MYE43393.1 hypothetical protein [Acidobacteriota bacterium]